MNDAFFTFTYELKRCYDLIKQRINYSYNLEVVDRNTKWVYLIYEIDTS